MDFSLSDEQAAIKEAAEEFGHREITPYARRWDIDEEIDRGIVAKLAESGFLGCVIPEDLGGMGLDNLSYCIIAEELGKACSSVRGIVSVNIGLVAKPIMKWGTEDQKREWLPQLASGAALGCFALTETESGSDPASLSTRAEREGGDYILTGSKMFITNGSWAGIALVFARTGGAGAKGVSCFIVPTSSAGYSTKSIRGKLGLRGQDTAEIYLDGVRVPERNCLGGVGNGLKVALSTLDGGRMGLAAGCVGISQACLEAATRYSSERKQFGRTISSFQLIQGLLSDIAVDTQAARLLTWQAATLADSGVKKYTLEASFAKYFASEAAVRSANAALQVHGGYGYIDEFAVGKYMRDARVTTLYEGTSQIQKLLIGRQITGENAFA